MAYPLQLSGQSCVVSSGYMCCVGAERSDESPTNAVYFAPVSSGDVEAWKKAANYPVSARTTCVISTCYLYCTGGFDSNSKGKTSATY
jgi:hypothetical protein